MAIVTVLSVEALLLIFFNIYLILQLTMIVLRVPLDMAQQQCHNVILTETEMVTKCF